MKKDKKVKTPSKFKAWRMKMKETPKGRAYLKLIYWAIFFAVLFIFLGIASMMGGNANITNNNNTEENPIDNTNDDQEVESTSRTIEEMEEELLESTYEYTYDIRIGEYMTYLFDGTKYDTYEEGYKNFAMATSAGVMRYVIDDTGIYQIVGNERTLIDNFYEGLDANLLNLEYLFNTMNNLGLTEDSLVDATYPVYYATDSIYRYQMSLNEESMHITNITITSLDESSSYDLSFSRIGEISNE